METFKLSETTRELLAQLIDAEKIEEQFRTSGEDASKKLVELERRAILAGGNTVESNSGETQQIATDITGFRFKIEACQAIRAELREKILTLIDVDRLAALEELRNRGESLRKEADQLQSDFIKALAKAKVAEIKLRRWHEDGNRLGPAIATHDPAIWNSFFSEVERLCAAQGIDSSWLSPADQLKECVRSAAEFRKPVTCEDVDRAIEEARREAIKLASGTEELIGVEVRAQDAA